LLYWCSKLISYVRTVTVFFQTRTLLIITLCRINKSENMRHLFLILFIVIPTVLFSQKSHDKKYDELKSGIIELRENYEIIDSLENEISLLSRKFEEQAKINEQSFNSISNQLSAASYSITIFGILFAIVAVIIGIYVTYVEKKIVRIREENKELLSKSKIVKNEVVATNELIQKDINGLFLRIKREETLYILNRLLKVPRDIANVSSELLSRELERDDFRILKKAYLSLDELLPLERGFFTSGLEYKDSYILIFYQHFFDLAIKDESIGPDLISFYPHAMICSFENDIVNSTKDFIKAIVDLGYQTRLKEISSFFNGLSNSSFCDFEELYMILFDGLKSRDDTFKFFNLIPDSEECRVGKKNFGQILVKEFEDKEPTESEKIVFEMTKTIDSELKEEEQKRIEEEVKRKKVEEERKRKAEEKIKAREDKNNSAQQSI
jgi:hypothetical protein